MTFVTAAVLPDASGQDWQVSSVKGQGVNILGSAGHWAVSQLQNSVAVAREQPQTMNEWARLRANETLLTILGSQPDVAVGLRLPSLHQREK